MSEQKEVKHYRLDFLYRNGEAEADMKECQSSRFSYVKSSDYNAQSKLLAEKDERIKSLECAIAHSNSFSKERIAELEKRPTEYAYEQVCKANEEKRAEIQRLREGLSAIVNDSCLPLVRTESILNATKILKGEVKNG